MNYDYVQSIVFFLKVSLHQIHIMVWMKGPTRMSNAPGKLKKSEWLIRFSERKIDAIYPGASTHIWASVGKSKIAIKCLWVLFRLNFPGNFPEILIKFDWKRQVFHFYSFIAFEMKISRRNRICCHCSHAPIIQTNGVIWRFIFWQFDISLISQKENTKPERST